MRLGSEVRRAWNRRAERGNRLRPRCASVFPAARDPGIAWQTGVHRLQARREPASALLQRIAARPRSFRMPEVQKSRVFRDRPSMTAASQNRPQSRGSRPEATSSSRTPSQTVGTPAENVTPSACAISTRRLAAMSCPTITCLAPVMADINGRPQQFAWNMGTTGITTSRAEIPNASTRHPFMACKTVERWEKSTPFGSPVVPEV